MALFVYEVTVCSATNNADVIVKLPPFGITVIAVPLVAIAPSLSMLKNVVKDKISVAFSGRFCI